MLQSAISIHAPRTGSDPARGTNEAAERHFNPRSPHGERPEKPPAAHQPPEISIHAPRTGSDPAAHQPPEEAEISIHAPRTGSDASPEYRLVRETRYFNPRSPHGERRAGKNRHETGRLISIHAPRTGSDTTRRTATHKRRRISIHAPRTGSDLHAGGRRAGHGDFNPRSPHGERLPSATRAFGTYRFQSTLPARGATKWTALKGLITEFQSTLPARGATCPGTPSGFAQKISIHAPRTGSDKRAARTICATPHFNPRSPHGERHFPALCAPNLVLFQSTLPARGATVSLQPSGKLHLFQSTLPARGATKRTIFKRRTLSISIHAPRTGSDEFGFGALNSFIEISIHAPRTGSDARFPRDWERGADFNPRSPHGERLDTIQDCIRNVQFQSTLPARGATLHPRRRFQLLKISIHAPRTGSDSAK